MVPLVIGSYMVCAILFILTLSKLSHQETAKRGNLYGVIAMILAIIATFWIKEFAGHYELWAPGFFLGGIIGLLMALRVEMISMPQMVAVLHSFVGIAATLVSFAYYFLKQESEILPMVETCIGVFIGAVTFTGSVVAWGKLEGVIRSKPLILCGWFRHVLNLAAISICIVLSVLFGLYTDFWMRLYFLIGNAVIAGALGWHLVMAIGGADMPVVVSMLNSYSGWTTVASGFLLSNQLLIIAGALIGSSGAILSYIMCRAMNRSFVSVVAGGFGQSVATTAEDAPQGEMKPLSSIEMTNLLIDAHDIVIVPGYGMAVARCQQDVGTLAHLLRTTGRTVSFCIHPVAGRLPGHMNVLLAEADVDYRIVKEMDELNPHFPTCDLVLVIGANDIVNPDAQDNPNSLIAGMPVCEVWKSKHVVVFKRGTGRGYAGIENPLFYKENTRIYYGSADKSVKEILNSITVRPEFSREYVEEEDESSPLRLHTAEEEISYIPPHSMTLGIPKETFPKERRVAMTPSMVTKFRTLGFQVKLETGAGDGAKFTDAAYEQAGANIVDTAEVYNSDVVAKIRAPSEEEVSYLSTVKCLISYVYPASSKDWLSSLAGSLPDLTYIAMDCVPRSSKAQKLDSLSSMANIAGYRAVIEAFQYFQRCPKPMVTAAGKLPPAEVLVIGAGVAGLSAIGYLKNLGCIVYAMDTRSAARGDAESMGAKFLEVSVKEEGAGAGGYAKEMSEKYKKAQAELMANTVAQVDIVITTALIPGRPAPRLLDEALVDSMKPGSVVVDMAAEMGGNCSVTQPDEVVVTEKGVSVVGFTDLSSRMAPQSSELYANNIWNLLDHLGKATDFKIDLRDDITKAIAVVHAGEMTWTPLPPPPPAPATQGVPLAPLLRHESIHAEASCFSKIDWFVTCMVLIGMFVGLSYLTEAGFMGLFNVFVLTVFIGYMVIWNVTPALHTPLMSVTNAISGIIVIGSMLTLDQDRGLDDPGTWIGVLSVFFASINIWGGFVVTHRMLAMFRTGH